MQRNETFRQLTLLRKAHIHRVTETRVSSISSLLSIFRKLTTSQLPYRLMRWLNNKLRSSRGCGGISLRSNEALSTTSRNS